MAITNGYATLNEVKAATGISPSDADHDDELEAAVEAASRQIDAHCGQGRRFWQDSATVDRYYFPEMASVVHVDDISTLTGLVVAVDEGDDGTFSTTLTKGTDFDVWPINAAAEYPVQPWTQLRVLDGQIGRWVRLGSGRPYVKVTAKFGWSAVPGEITRACVFQARNIYQAKSEFGGSIELSPDGIPLRNPAMNPQSLRLIQPFVRYDEINNG